MKKKKQRRNPKPQNDDIISALSDELLLHIISFLPAATAFATSLLSHRWRHLWDNLLALYFHFHDGHHQIDFIKLVNGVISRRKQPNVRKLHLLSPSTTTVPIQNRIATWIDAILGPHLQEISLTLSSPCFFPPCILRCESLVSLHLECRQMHLENICNIYHLPSLKKLVLKLCAANSVMPLLSCCPNLETLELDFHHGIIFFLNFGMLPSLKSLTLLGLGIRVYEIIINTPLLEYLNINIESTKCITFSVTSNFQNLVRVHYNIVHLHHIKDVVNLLNKIYRAQRLTWNVSRLKKNKRAWKEPRIAPSCVESHLKDVEFRGYCDSKQEHGFLGYILHRGHVLKKMKIMFHGLKKSPSVDIRKQQVQTLSTLPRSSNTCQLLFD
ncbi:hypothetical protein PIB30_010406 [Stylosanthes scabra]|uniref:F-box domain-containing protein n=1 Tax=Stylosanthes scabra TaxID=79078 RepID=A0ABU6X3V2_9FABA|nr:hypothetical protein [Stylosanthes scabra]